MTVVLVLVSLLLFFRRNVCFRRLVMHTIIGPLRVPHVWLIVVCRARFLLVRLTLSSVLTGRRHCRIPPSSGFGVCVVIGEGEDEEEDDDDDAGVGEGIGEEERKIEGVASGKMKKGHLLGPRRAAGWLRVPVVVLVVQLVGWMLVKLAKGDVSRMIAGERSPCKLSLNIVSVQIWGAIERLY